MNNRIVLNKFQKIFISINKEIQLHCTVYTVGRYCSLENGPTPTYFCSQVLLYSICIYGLDCDLLLRMTGNATDPCYILSQWYQGSETAPKVSRNLLVVNYGGWREGPWTFNKLSFLMIGSKPKFAAENIVDTGGKFAFCITTTATVPVVNLDLRKSPEFSKNSK